MEDSKAAAFSIDQWCAHHGLSRGTYYNLKAAGKAPRTYRVGARELISRPADAEWVREREAAEPEESAAFRERRKSAGAGVNSKTADTDLSGKTSTTPHQHRQHRPRR